MRNKTLIIGLLGLFGLIGNALAQSAPNGLNMPFSQFGIGLCEQPYNLPMVTRMGGVIYTRSGNNWINPFNPASYASIETESFVFDMAAGVQITRLQNNNSSVNDAEGNVNYLMFGFPITKWWKIACGLMPYSTVDYDYVETGIYHVNNKDYGLKERYYGKGGISTVFLGSAFNVIGKANAEGRRLQLGFNLVLITGNVERNIFHEFQRIDTTFFIDYSQYKKSTVLNLMFDFGIQYREPLNKKYTLGVGLLYKPYRNMSVEDKALIYTYHPNQGTLRDTVFPAAGQSDEFNSSLELDHTIGIGLSLERNGRWAVSADATFAGWSGLKYTEGKDNAIFGESLYKEGPYSRYALGFEKIGSMDASSYWGRISWSLGVHAELGTLRLMYKGHEEVVNEWGCGLGVTLPMRKGQSSLTLSAGFSSLGNKDLLQRNCLSFGIAVSSCERWFVKRKYN